MRKKKSDFLVIGDKNLLLIKYKYTLYTFRSLFNSIRIQAQKRMILNI